jgi:putative ABC transport system ATP-binding protein
MQTLQLKQVVTRHVGPIDLTLHPAETVGLSGHSGTGKSLLLRAIADLDPHQGEIFLDNQRQADMAAPEWRSRVAYFAAESQWWSDTVNDHFNTEDKHTLQNLLQQAGFTPESLQWSVHRLSSGEKQRLAIVRQLLHKPQVLLLDEPTASLDPENRQCIEQLLFDYQQQQRASLLWVSHDAAQLQRIAQRQFRIEAGTLLEQQP